MRPELTSQDALYRTLRPAGGVTYPCILGPLEFSDFFYSLVMRHD